VNCNILTTVQYRTSSAVCCGADTICPRPLQVVTWTTTQSFQPGGQNTLIIY